MRLSHNYIKYIRLIIPFTLGMFLALLRVYMPSSKLNAQGIEVWVEILATVFLYIHIMFIAGGLGLFIIRKFAVSISQLEKFILTFMIGLGILSTGLAILGVLKYFNIIYIFIYLFVISCFSFGELIRKPIILNLDFTNHYPQNKIDTILVLLLLIILFLSFSQTLAPAWDYDALLYHLTIPKLFLENEGIYFDENIVRANYPLLSQTLFSIGIAFRLDSLSKLVNFTYSLLWLGSIYAFTSRFFPARKIGLVAISILAGTPSFVVWSNWVGVDFACTVYEFWTVYALIIYFHDSTNRPIKWIALSGLMAGFAASTKYTALPSVLISFFLLLSYLVSNKKNYREVFKIALVFGVSAGAVMGIWYLKNLIWANNPVYPMIWGGPGWSLLDNKIWNDYVYSFGMSKNLLNIVLFPIHVYIYQAYFSTTPVEIIHPILWLTVIIPILRISRSIEIRIPLLYITIYAIYWLLGSQVIRFLLPLSGFLSIFAALILTQFSSRLHRTAKIMLVIFFFYSMVFPVLYIHSIGLADYYRGRSTKKELLLASVNNFALTSYITESLSNNERVQFLWDGRGYYCDSRCIPDNRQSLGILLSINQPDPTQLVKQLQQNHITHIALSLEDVQWFINYHDPEGKHQKALNYFTDIFLPACGQLIFETRNVKLFKINCNEQ